MGKKLQPDRQNRDFAGKYEKKTLHEAVTSNDETLVEAILEEGNKDINLGGSPKSLLLIALENKNSRIATSLIKHNINVNVNAYEILLEVIKNQYTEIFDLLAEKRIEAGSRVSNRTPKLRWHIENRTKGRFRTALTDYMDAYEHPEEEGLIEAAEHGDIFKLKTLLRWGCNVNYQNEDGRTPLLAAVLKKQKEAMEILMDSHADINVKSEQGVSALHMAIFDGNPELLETLRKYNPNPDVRDNFGETPLMRAIESKNKGIVDMLLEMGSDVELKNDLGISVLKIAIMSKDKEIIETIMLAKDRLTEEERLWVEDWRKTAGL